MHRASWIGLFLGFGAILLGNFFEGGHFSSLLQGSAFLIVIGGTIGAVFLAHDLKTVQQAAALAQVALGKRWELPRYDQRLLEYAKTLRKEGPAALEKLLQETRMDEFERQGVRMLVDGLPAPHVERLLSDLLLKEQNRLMESAKVWSDAGGYAPTMGILGAVLGLIHVMANLTDTSKLGAGIAVAFVATIYGVAFANLLFLPLASKIKLIIQHQIENKRRLMRGLVALANNESIASINAQVQL